MNGGKLIFLFAFLFFVNLYPQNWQYQIGDHELLAMPTAYTMPAGNGYFTDYEAILLNFVYAPLNRTHIGVFTMFPVTSEFINTFSIGVKQNFFKYKIFQSAVYGTLTPKASLYVLGGVVSIGKPTFGFHMDFSYAGHYDEDDTDDGGFLFSFGLRYDFKENFAGIIEYHSPNNSSVIEMFSEYSMILFGLRFHYEYTSWEIAGFRPLSSYSSDLILYPFLKGTYYFH